MENEAVNQTWQSILVEALTKPGIVSSAYQNFHNYSMGNQLLAMIQCCGRKITVGPIQTYAGWKAWGAK